MASVNTGGKVNEENYEQEIIETNCCKLKIALGFPHHFNVNTTIING